MNKTLATITATAALVGLSVGHVHADEPTATVQAACDGLTVTTSGWADGTTGIFSAGGEPPIGVTINDTWTHPVFHGYTESTSYGLLVYLADGTLAANVIGMSRPCETIAPPDMTPWVGDEPVDTPPAILFYNPPAAVWADVALAPPW